MPMHAHQVRWQCSGRTLGVAGDDASQTTTRVLQKRDTTSEDSSFGTTRSGEEKKCGVVDSWYGATGWAIRRRGSGSGGTAR